MANVKIKKVYLIRHGQSVANIAPVIQSTTSPLTEKGKQQAQSIANRMAKLSFEALIASPYQRAKETAEIIEKTTGKKPMFSNLFTERVKPTSINGKPHDDENAVTTFNEWKKSLYVRGMRVEDGENFDDLMERADKALAFLKNRPEQSLVVVTHGFFLRTIIVKVLLGDLVSEEVLKRFQNATTTENTGITVLQYQAKGENEPAWNLWIYNDHAHLAN